MPLPRPQHFLQQFKNLVFIETGSNHGDGIQGALDAGFECIYSVELSQFAFGWCNCRFEQQRTKVNLFQNDSRQFLSDLLPTVTTRVTFWLDAHECGTDAGDANDCPLMKELELIAQHEIKQHTILIDDVRLFGSGSFPTLEMISDILFDINKDYKITFVDSSDFKADILVAVPPYEPA